jgi:hypothetical protein
MAELLERGREAARQTAEEPRQEAEEARQAAEDIRRQRHIGDFQRWKDHDAYQLAFTRLLRDLKATDAK